MSYTVTPEEETQLQGFRDIKRITIIPRGLYYTLSKEAYRWNVLCVEQGMNILYTAEPLSAFMKSLL
jgi:hypothetical protein